jgi:hypothetical protein
MVENLGRRGDGHAWICPSILIQCSRYGRMIAATETCCRTALHAILCYMVETRPTPCSRPCTTARRAPVLRMFLPDEQGQYVSTDMNTPSQGP